MEYLEMQDTSALRGLLRCLNLRKRSLPILPAKNSGLELPSGKWRYWSHPQELSMHCSQNIQKRTLSLWIKVAFEVLNSKRSYLPHVKRIMHI